MSNYTKTTAFTPKDSLNTGNPSKVVKGSEFDTEFDNIAIAIATKANSTNAVLVTPALGTPSAGVLTNCTGLPMTTGVTGTLAVGNGGTGSTSAGTTGQILVSNGTVFAPATRDDGLVLLSTTTLSADTSKDIETGFSSTYDDYLMICSIALNVSQSIVARMKLGGAYVTSSTYYLSATSDSVGSSTVDYGRLTASGTLHEIHLKLSKVNGSTVKTAFSDGQSYATTPSITRFTYAIMNSGTGVLSGIRLLGDAGTAQMTGTVRLYGYRK